MALDVGCGNCKHKQSRSICGKPGSPYFKQKVELADHCDFYMGRPAQEYFKQGIIKCVAEPFSTQGTELYRTAIDLGLPEDDEMFARFAIAETHVNLALAAREQLTDEQFTSSPHFIEALSQAEKAILIDRQGQYQYFADPLNRGRLRVVDELYVFPSYVLEKTKGVDAAIGYLKQKVELVSYLSTTPLIRAGFRLGDLYEKNGEKDSAAV